MIGGAVRGLEVNGGGIRQGRPAGVSPLRMRQEGTIMRSGRITSDTLEKIVQLFDRHIRLL
ncbi:MAG: hypothetical protein PWP08_1015 [Methanofollis sp.]|nr:hypothetical protein [Methanofollis sp.]